jgi:hypothetical protein
MVNARSNCPNQKVYIYFFNPATKEWEHRLSYSLRVAGDALLKHTHDLCAATQYQHEHGYREYLAW